MRQSFYKKALIIAGGVLINFFLGWLLIFIVMIVGIPQGIFVADIKPESLAYYSGFEKGDLILNFKNADEFNDYLKQSIGKEADFKIKRSGIEKDMIVNFPKEGSKTGEILGIYYSETGMPKVGILKGIVESFRSSCDLVVSYLGGYISMIGGLFTGSSIFQNLMGPVGLFAMGSLVSKAGLIYFIQLLASLSINLIVFNFLPFPMLDGGWFIIVLIEKIKGSPVSQKTEMIVNGFGFLALFSLLLITTVKDVINLF
jgi:regulator of sigma E protease